MGRANTGSDTRTSEIRANAGSHIRTSEIIVKQSWSQETKYDRVAKVKYAEKSINQSPDNSVKSSG